MKGALARTWPSSGFWRAFAPPGTPLLVWICLLALLGGCAVLGIYTMIAEFLSGHTVGKRLVGARVVRESGARISFGRVWCGSMTSSM